MGVFWGTWFALSRSITGFSPQAFLEIGQTAIRNLAVPMRFLMPLSLLSAAFMLALLPKRSVLRSSHPAGSTRLVVQEIRRDASFNEAGRIVSS